MININHESKSYQNILQEIEYFFQNDSILIGRYHLSVHFILASGMDEKTFYQKVTQLAKTLKKYDALPLGIGQVVHTLEQVHYSYQTARIAIEYGEQENSIIYFEDVELYSLLKSREYPEVKHFTNRVLHKLDEKLLLTLQVYFDCDKQLAICAKNLEIHRHTLTYRLKKIVELTGYNPTKFHDALILQIALWLTTKN